MLQLESSISLGSDFNQEVMGLISPDGPVDLTESADIRASELSAVMNSLNSSQSAAIDTLDDNQLLENISFEESKDDVEDLTARERE